MSRNRDETRRVKFFGLGDYGTYWQVARAFEVLDEHDGSNPSGSVNDILELHNAALYVEAGILPRNGADDQSTKYEKLALFVKKTVAMFFNSLNDETLASAVINVNYEYYSDLLEQFSRFKVYDRCSAAVMLGTLAESQVGLSDMLTNKDLVKAYDHELRTALVSDAANAEHLVRKHLEEPGRRAVYLPASFTAEDSRALLGAYIASADAHPNIIELISTARVNAAIGIDAKIKLSAQRRHNQLNQEFFKENSGIKTGCEVSIADGQDEPVMFELDGMVAKLSYSRQWLEAHTDYPTILNNFLYVFEMTNRRMLLTLPAYPADIGPVEGLIMTAGKDSYRGGAAFRLSEQRSFLNVVLYGNFLRERSIELEAVISWFFSDYLKDEFGADGFRFMPASKSSTYLEKSRHLFVEMESIVKQFALYVDNGEIDTELMAVVSEQVRYKAIPSLAKGKYAYASADRDVHNVMRLLFSDQSGLGYISEALRAETAEQLILRNDVSYGDFHEYQQQQIDYLVELDVLQVDDAGFVQFASIDQLVVLKDLFRAEAISCLNHSDGAQATIDALVAKGWLVTAQTLLTTAEASYYNYCLNQAEFSNGLDLRNTYLHGSHVDPGDETRHFHTYITALKLLLALVIKINDDFCVAERTRV